MPNYTVKDEGSGKTITFEWNDPNPPTDADMQEVFAQAQTGQAEQPQGNFLQRSLQAIKQRGQNIATEFEPRPGETREQSIERAGERALRTTGQVAGGIGDIAGEALKSAYTTLVPKSTQTNLQRSWAEANEADRRWNEARVARVNKEQGTNLVPRTLVQGFQEDILSPMQQKHPELLKNLTAMANIGALASMSKKPVSGTVQAKALLTPYTDLKRLPETLNKFPWPKPIDRKMDAVITKTIEKAIRPSVEGKRTFGTMSAYLRKSKDAVKSIVANKDKLNLTDEFGESVSGLPTSLKQFSQAIGQTKESIFHQYDAMAKATGTKGAQVTLVPISNELKSISASRVLQDSAPNIAAYAKDLSERYMNRGAYTAQEAQEAIKHFNNTLEAFYKNPTYDTASKAYIDSLVVNKLRASLDSVIEKSAGKGYQELKNSYGALKAIERDVNRRAIVDARRNVKGLIDFSDVFSGGTAIHGILNMNPAVVGQAAATKGIANLYKMLNDPNRIVKGMFSDVEKLMEKQTTGGQVIPKAIGLGVKGAKSSARFAPVAGTAAIEKEVVEK